MKALFAHDHRFIPAEGKIWSESQFEAALWQRYLAHFPALTVAARLGRMPEAKGTGQMELSSAPQVAFELFPNMSSLRGLTVGRPSAARRMHALVATHDAVIARLPSEIGLLAIDAARRLRKPWAVEVVGCPWDGLWNYGNLPGRIYAPIATSRMRRAVSEARHAIYVTNDFLQRRYPSAATNIATASNVILPAVSRTVLETRIRGLADLRGRPLRLGLIGTLRGRFKGIQTLLSALSQARASMPEFRLHVLGGGDAAPWNAEARQLGLEGIVHFDGTVPAGEPVFRWLDGIDIYLQPSLKEGLPRALIEAMSRGCPAIASSVAGIPELLPSEDMIQPGDAAGLARLLQRRCNDLEWMRQRAERNWHTAMQYRTEVLEPRRYLFWKSFRDSVDLDRKGQKWQD